MAAGTKYSVNLTNLTATPITILDRKRGVVNSVVDTVEVATTNIDDVGDIILMAAVPSNARLTSVVIYNDDLDAHATPTLAANIGLYYGGNNVVSGVTKTVGSVISATCIGTAITTLQAANTLGVEHRFEADDIANIGKEAWEVAGLTEDCGGIVFVGLTISAAAATGAAGTISIRVKYI
jgi:hypothetical protein